MAKLSKTQMKKVWMLALSIGLLHHTYHLWVQPWFNRTFPKFFDSLPDFLIGSTSVVTVFIVVIVWIGGRWILLKK